MTILFTGVSSQFDMRVRCETDPLTKALLINCAKHACETYPVVNEDRGSFRLRHGPRGAGVTIDIDDHEAAIAACRDWLASLHPRSSQCVEPYCTLHCPTDGD